MPYMTLLRNALPRDMQMAELTIYGRPDWWQNRQRLAMAYALRKCARLNWTAYLANNDDVKASGIDPVLHFLRDGIFEGRKLYSWHPLRETARTDAPKVSVIVLCYNNDLFLEKCLNSIVSQTLDCIEIIIVNDCSSDHSLAIAHAFAAVDARIKLISLRENSGIHMARSAGVNAASGDYIMFLDGDDFYAPDACEKAWQMMQKGADIGAFNCKLVNHASLPETQIREAEAYFNRGDIGLTEGDVVSYSFLEDKIGHNVNFKIFLRELLQSAFAGLVKKRLTRGEDMYEYLVCANMARSLSKIDDKLYYYSRGSGISIRSDYLVKRFEAPESECALWLTAQYCKEHNLYKYGKYFENRSINDIINLLPRFPSDKIEAYYARLIELVGAMDAVALLMRKYHDQPSIVTETLSALPAGQGKSAARKIGIFYFRLSPGGIETTILLMCDILRAEGLQPVLFLTERSDYTRQFEHQFNIYYLARPRISLEGDEAFLRDLHAAVTQSGIDLIFYMSLDMAAIAWASLLMHFLDIPQIGYLASNFNIEMMNRGRKYTHETWLKTMASLDKVMCLSVSCEIYLRSMGIDACYIANPVKHFPDTGLKCAKGNNIAVIARLNDPIKKISQCLFVLAEVVKQVKNAKMIFIGDFADDAIRQQFQMLSQKLRLRRHLQITGWTDNPCHFIDQCKALFSASYIEGFPNGIAEAQARGLPIVMYHLDIMIAHGNESIFRVSQGDYKAAASKIVRLLHDAKLCETLAPIAKMRAARYSDARFADAILQLIQCYGRLSPWRARTPRQYQRVIDDLAFYAGQGWPVDDYYNPSDNVNRWFGRNV